MESMEEALEPEKVPIPAVVSLEEAIATNGAISPLGHPQSQKLERNFNLLSICGVAITTGNTWIAIGGSVVVAIYNGGPPGVIYEFIAVSVFYWLIAASIAELASAMPSSGGEVLPLDPKALKLTGLGIEIPAFPLLWAQAYPRLVYHWASITAGRYGRICGWYAGWWNFLAWIFGLASAAEFVGAQTVSMYAAFHPGFVGQRWHVFVGYVICTWVCCSIVLFANRVLPMLESLGGFLIIAGVLVTIVVCAIMPHINGIPYATNAFVWRDWENATGYTNNGFVFVLGMLNGAFAVGTPDIVSHLAEEIPRPSVNIPKAILAQFVIGFFTAFFYLITIFYGVSDLNAILTSGSLFPLASIYRQATGSAGGSLGLLILAFLPSFIGCIGCYLTASRTFWTLARDNATPFSKTFGCIHPVYKNPFNSILLCAVICTLLGCIYLGSSTAFNAFVGSYVVLSTLSYLAAILPHLLTKRSNVTPGWYWMEGAIGYTVNTISCLYIIAFVVIFCFPFSLPVTALTMNYTVLITGAASLFVGGFWFWRRHDYDGPRRILEAEPLPQEVM